MLTDDNEAVARQFYLDIFVKGNLQALPNYVAPSCALFMQGRPPGYAPGLTRMQASIASFLAVLPVAELNVEDVIGQGDRLVVRWAMRVRHMATYYGIPASGMIATIRGLDLFRLVERKIVEQWTYVDHEGLLDDLNRLGQFRQARRQPPGEQIDDSSPA
jgi:predicted ester cyclase